MDKIASQAGVNGERPIFVWGGTGGRQRNQFVLFRRDLLLDSTPVSAWLYLFADSRYRLRVNGQFVYAGPPRFVTEYPEYDTVDLSPYLQKGSNCLTVEVNAFGASSFQTMPNGRGGFIAWGVVVSAEGGEPVDLATPGDWRSRELSAWDSHAPLYSFAQNPVEIFDSRAFDDAWVKPGLPDDAGWSSPEPVPEDDAPWGSLRSSTAPVISYRPTVPVEIVFSASLDDREARWGFTIPEHYLGSPQTAPKGLFVAFSSWLYSSCEQTVPVGLHWGDFELNGISLKTVPHPKLGNRNEAILNFKEGWNHLTGMVEFMIAAEFWSFLIGLPKCAGLRPRARPFTAESAAFALSPLKPRHLLSLVWSEDPQAPLPDDWRLVDGDPLGVCPARLAAWTRPADDAVRSLPYVSLGDVAGIEGVGRVWVFRFTGGLLGHVTLDIEAPAGTIVDFGFDDWQRDDGMIDLYHTHPFINSVERVILRGGRQQVQLFHSRGGVFLQVLVRLPPDRSRCSGARLHGVGLLETKTIPDIKGSFSASNPKFDAIWRVAANTLSASTEDSYSDSPWRERGTYLGDSYVNLLLHRLIHDDLTVARRAICLFAQTATEEGQLDCVVPACLGKPHGDFTLIWVLLLHRYWEMSGDLALVGEVWPVVCKILNGTGRPRHRSGLWNADGERLFIDWGVVQQEREGQANAVLNAFRIAALDQAASLAMAIGRKAEATGFTVNAEILRAAFSCFLWQEETGRFAAGYNKTGRVQSSAFHANILAYCFNIGTPSQLKGVERYVIERARMNYQLGLAQGGAEGHAELYFLVYLLQALGDHGQVELAESLIMEHYGPIIDDGEETLPETFHGRAGVPGSRCHSWSGAPAFYLTRYLLGLKPAGGDPDHFILAPVASAGITSASGCLPHARGPIRVAWRRTPDGFIHSVEAPKGVRVDVEIANTIKKERG